MRNLSKKVIDMKYEKFVNSLNGCPFCNLDKEEILKKNSSASVILCRIPYVKGHILIVTNRCVFNYKELSKKEKIDLEKLLSWTIKNLKKKNESFSIMYREGNSKIVGGSVKHFHIHVLPNMKLGISTEDSNNRNVCSRKKYLDMVKKTKNDFS